MLLRKLFYSAFLVGASAVASSFTYVISESPFHSPNATTEMQPLQNDLQSLPISGDSNTSLNTPFNTSEEPQNVRGLPHSLYEKYGGYATIQKIVDDTSATLTVDPITAPFLLVSDSLLNNQDEEESLDKILSCLDQQFSALLGGPYNYPGISHFRSAPEGGYSCDEMQMVHTGLSTSVEAFDRFVVILSDVLKRNGIAPEDVDMITRSMAGLRNDMVVR